MKAVRGMEAGLRPSAAYRTGATMRQMQRGMRRKPIAFVVDPIMAGWLIPANHFFQEKATTNNNLSNNVRAITNMKFFLVSENWILESTQGSPPRSR